MFSKLRLFLGRLLAGLSISGFTQTLWMNFHIKYFDAVGRDTKNIQTSESRAIL